MTSKATGRQAVNLSWTSCFDTSREATKAYAVAVYGEDASTAFDWKSLNVVFPHFLQKPVSAGTSNESITRCLLQYEQVYKLFILRGALFVNYRRYAALGYDGPYSQYINRGGQRNPCGSAEWPWIEVAHQPSLSPPSRPKQPIGWSDQLWMYVANGTGLWYKAGRTLLCSDTVDLAIYLNYTTYRRRDGASKPPLFEEARRRLAGEFDSISFDNHIDGACCQRMVVHEIFSLQPSTRHCPVSTQMRRGARANLRQCNCSDGGGTVPPGPRCPNDGPVPLGSRKWSSNGSTMVTIRQVRDVHLSCEKWAVAESLQGTLVDSCSKMPSTPNSPSGWNPRLCRGACCRHLPWPRLGANVPGGYPYLEPVC